MICIKCLQDKPLGQFYKNKTALVGYGQPCKVCHGIRQRELNKTREDRKQARLATIPQGFMQCKWCNAIKPSEEFHKTLRTKNRRTQPCRACYAHQQIEWREKNKQKVIDIALKSRKKHGVNISVRQKTKYHENLFASRAYGILATARRRARIQELPATFTKIEEAFMFRYWGYACAICGREEGFQWTLALDHFIPLTAQDSPGTTGENMLPLCHTKQGNYLSCNNSKGSKDPSIWLIERFGKRKANNILKKIATYFAIVRQRQHEQAS